MNIALMMTVLLAGLTDARAAKILGWYTIVAGIGTLLLSIRGTPSESLDSLFVLMFILIFMVLATARLLQPRRMTAVKEATP